QVEHSHHRNDPDSNAFAELTREQFGCLSHLDAFDLVTTLTEQQRRDMDELKLTADTLQTVPNLTEDLHGDSTTLRPRGRGDRKSVVQAKRREAVETRRGQMKSSSTVK